MKMIRAVMNKRPLDDQIQHLQLEIARFFHLVRYNIVTHGIKNLPHPFA